MNRNRTIGFIVIILLIIAGILFFIFMNPEPSATGNETKIGIYNNGTTWIHVLMAFENVTTINGTTNKSLGDQGPMVIDNGTANVNTTTFYVDAWLKPNQNETSVDRLTGKEIINLSEIVGYKNQAIPNGVSFPTKIWICLYGPGINESAEPVSNTSFLIQGWSMNSSSPANPKLVTVKAIDPELYNFEFPNRHVNPLPADITDNKLTIINDPSVFAAALSGMGNDTQYIDATFIDVDSDFKLIIEKNSLFNLGFNNTGDYGPNSLCAIADH
jgi:hypothetical protein